MDRKDQRVMHGNILVLTQWSFKDALVQTYTLPYVELIRKVLPAPYKIFIVTQEQEKLAINEPEELQINRDWTDRNIQLIAQPYKKFGWRKLLSAAWELAELFALIKKEDIKTIHAFCTPAGGIGYVLSKLTGVRLIIDSYEPHAEAMVENKTWDESDTAYKMLHFLEKRQTQNAHSLIATTSGMKRYAKERFGIEIRNFFVKPACVDLNKFSPREKDQALLSALQLKDKIVCVYAGKLGGIYLKEEIFDFVRCCYGYWGDKFRFLMLTNASREEIDSEVQRVQLPTAIVSSLFVLHEDVPRYLSLGDFAINPVKPVPTKRYCTSIKDGEYWAMGLPVVITPNISDDSAIIEKNRMGYVLKDLTEEEYTNAVYEIERLFQEDHAFLKQKIRSVAEQYRSFTIAENIYRSIYN